jgi:23S rRNA (cytosine1962-C5)-methyltransferase
MKLPAAWEEALTVREPMPELRDPNATMRLLHTEDPYVRADRFGDVVWIYWYHLDPPSEQDLQNAQELCRRANGKRWALRRMKNRGQDPHSESLILSEDFTSWSAKEHGVRYLLKCNQGLSPGLFLDQRANRKWLLENAKGKSLLNLFSYTGGFGLVASKGGAQKVVNIDTSKATLAWAKENAECNSLTMDYVAMDAREFLKMSRRKEKLFDYIVCDPPSFARSKKGVWKVEKDLPDLLRLLTPVLAPDGTALLSSNFEGWSYKRFRKTVENSLPEDYTFKAKRSGLTDFPPLNGEDLMKTCFIQRTP